MKQYEYKYERIELGGVFSANMKSDYKQIIESYTSRGWRFVQIFSPEYTGNGVPKCLDLIFEREVN